MWIYLIILVLTTIYFYFKHRHSYWERLGFAKMPEKVTFGTFFQDSSDFIRKGYEKFKSHSPAFGIFYRSNETLVLTDLELIHEILVKNFENFSDHGFSFNDFKDPLMRNIYNTSDEKWDDLTSKAHSMFTKTNIKNMLPILSLAGIRLTDYLESSLDKSEEIEIKEIFQKFSLEVIASTAFGLETKCLGESDHELFNLALKSAEENIFVLEPKEIPKKSSIFFMKILHDSLIHRETNQILRHDFFQLIMNMMKRTDDRMTFEEMTSVCYSFLANG